MRSPLHLLGLALVASTVAGCGPATPDPMADVPGVADLRARFEAAENAGDATAAAATFAEDVILMAPNAPAIEGAATVAQHLREEFDAVRLAVRYRSAEVTIAGDWAYDRGTYVVTVTPKAEGAATTGAGKYLWVSRRGADGAWKHTRIIWNSDGEAKPQG